jgi:hypothetical protein
MSTLVYRILALLAQVLARVPVGTNLGLCHLLFALLCGRFLAARGAVFPALAEMGLPAEAVRRAAAALCYGRWQTADLLARWQRVVAQEGRFAPCAYEGVRPVACDLSAFFRPQLQGLSSKHYVSEAGKALPAVVFGLCVAVGHVGQTRLCLPRLVLRPKPGEGEADLQRRLIEQAAQTLAPDEALVVDAGFALAALLDVPGLRFAARVRTNQTARRRQPPAYRGHGRRPTRGLLVRPLARTRAGRTIAATPPDARAGAAHWTDGKHRLWAEVWNGLVLPDARARAATFRLVAIYDPRYRQPLLLASNLLVSPEALWRLYKDRWAIEQWPLSAKPMLGAERAFVSGQQSRWRLPELALLAGNLLSYVAATQAPVASGFWDRAARPTCGRVRRTLWRVHCAELPVAAGQLRKKDSVTAHLKTGVEAHRRHKVVQAPREAAHAARFTGN